MLDQRDVRAHGNGKVQMPFNIYQVRLPAQRVTQQDVPAVAGGAAAGGR